jgi:protein-disulfide isomerase
MFAALLAAAALTASDVPRADLSGLSDAQKDTFLQVASEVFNYAGCQDTLAKCLGKGQRDPHAPRMAALVRQLVLDGFPAQTVIQGVETYYASFDSRARAPVNDRNCATLGKGTISIVEFSDYQCPHCRAALKPLHDLVTKDEAGKAKLCSKYFPFPSHPRARVAAGCAEYARAHGKFWELNELLFDNQESLEDADLKAYARKAGLDGDEMLKQVYAGAFDQLIDKHVREGTAAGVEETPSLFFNGRPLVLPRQPFYLRQSVQDELEWSKTRGWKFEKRRS